ncbi:MAG: copper-binding protein [Acidobacteriota bacterium]|nr:copper-binding protein [Acidobacteriota bacterium]
MKIGIVVLFAAFLAACGRSSNSSEAERHYPLSGKIVALDNQHQTATIDAAAIPNYMEAMTMEYPIKSKSDYQSLHLGEQIQATLDVRGDDSYSVSNVKQAGAPK